MENKTITLTKEQVEDYAELLTDKVYDMRDELHDRGNNNQLGTHPQDDLIKELGLQIEADEALLVTLGFPIQYD